MRVHESWRLKESEILSSHPLLSIIVLVWPRLIEELKPFFKVPCSYLSYFSRSWFLWTWTEDQSTQTTLWSVTDLLLNDHSFHAVCFQHTLCAVLNARCSFFSYFCLMLVLMFSTISSDVFLPKTFTVHEYRLGSESCHYSWPVGNWPSRCFASVLLLLLL